MKRYSIIVLIFVLSFLIHYLVIYALHNGSIAFDLHSVLTSLLFGIVVTAVFYRFAPRQQKRER